MATASVSVTFECNDLADAEQLISGWKLHEGCTIYATVTQPMSPRETGRSGELKVAPSESEGGGRMNKTATPEPTAPEPSEPEPSEPEPGDGEEE